jgi:hypothetical protein
MSELKTIIDIIKDTGMPVLTSLCLAFICWLGVKYLNVKYSLNLFQGHKNRGIGTSSPNIKFVTYQDCVSHRNETDKSLREMTATINEIKGSTAVIREIVVNKLGNN